MTACEVILQGVPQSCHAEAQNPSCISSGTTLLAICELKLGSSHNHPCLQIRETRVDYREATGPCKARALAQKLWAGEEYYLQLDAHMRFAPGWDKALMQWLRQAEADHPGSKPVLSTYPPGYEVCSVLSNPCVCYSLQGPGPSTCGIACHVLIAS